MMLNRLMAEKSLNKYRLAKVSGVPYTTISDICNQKAKMEKCSAETIYKIAKALDVSMETLMESHFVKRCSFENFKSNVCHRVKEMGDIDFIIDTLERDEIRQNYERKWYAESFYLLAMLDYLSRLNDVPLCSRYDDLRRYRLQEMVYPASVLMAAAVSPGSEKIKEHARRESIPEFIRFNIIENEVHNVI